MVKRRDNAISQKYVDLYAAIALRLSSTRIETPLAPYPDPGSRTVLALLEETLDWVVLHVPVIPAEMDVLVARQVAEDRKRYHREWSCCSLCCNYSIDQILSEM